VAAGGNGGGAGREGGHRPQVTPARVGTGGWLRHELLRMRRHRCAPLDLVPATDGRRPALRERCCGGGRVTPDAELLSYLISCCRRASALLPARGACLRDQERGGAGLLRRGRSGAGRLVREPREGWCGQEGVWLHGPTVACAEGETTEGDLGATRAGEVGAIGWTVWVADHRTDGPD
jgi:hypothetical protein